MELRPPNIRMEPTLHRPRVVVSPGRAAHLARKVPINAVEFTDVQRLPPRTAPKQAA